MTDRRKWYTPYQQDIDDIERRESNRSSATQKLLWLTIWFILITIFV